MRYQPKQYSTPVRIYSYIALPLFFVALVVAYPLALAIGVINVFFLAKARLT